MVYEPLVCLILQGAKETRQGDERVLVRAGHAIVVSHPMPVVARVLEASPERPYLALVARLDLTELRALHDDLGDDVGHDVGRAGTGPAVTVAPMGERTLDVLGRYLALAHEPDDAKVLVPGLRRELHYRLLKADTGGMLRALLRRDSHASNVSRAIQTLRRDFKQRIEMVELAHSVGMSASLFYKHFKGVTSTTPLQYQKDLRLTEARRLLLGGEHSVATAAYAVGYESPSQFSREYSRKFGVAPRTDRDATR